MGAALRETAALALCRVRGRRREADSNRPTPEQYRDVDAIIAALQEAGHLPATATEQGD